MNKLLLISGPTASGKTALGFLMGKKLQGEIVSADSRQVYKGMDLVTGKEEDPVVKTWLIDVVDPDDDFNVATYYELAWKAIRDIWDRGKLPIVVGGTGFYIKALLDGIGTMGIPPNWKMRNEFSKLSIEELAKILQKIDAKKWDVMNASDRKNPRRLIRAIEIANYIPAGEEKVIVAGDDSGLKLEELSSVAPQDFIKTESDFFWIGLTMPTSAVLYERIDLRVDERVALGALEEARRLGKEYGWNISSMTGQGYRELRECIEGKISLNEAINRWKFAEHAYARKQMTWFKKEKRILWFDATAKNFPQIAE